MTDDERDPGTVPHPAAPEQTEHGFDEGLRQTPREEVVGRFDEGEAEHDDGEKRHRGRFDDRDAEPAEEGSFDESEPPS